MSLPLQVYNIKQAKRDIDAVYSMGLFDDVNILPSPSEDSNMENPKVSQNDGLCHAIPHAHLAGCRCTDWLQSSHIACNPSVRLASKTLLRRLNAA